jgi:dolichyl-phosphate beta-glucosyltransferase
MFITIGNFKREMILPMVLAKRKAAGGRASRSFFRELMAAIFSRLTDLLVVPGIADTQCGFKLLHRSAAKRLFGLAVERGWAFDVEILFLAQKLGMEIMEVPVQWSAVEGSKLSPAKDVIKMLRAILRIRRRCAGLVDGVGTEE